MSERIDELLGQPLLPVTDNGFSKRVIARIETEERRRSALALGGVLAGIALVSLFLPLPEIAAAFDTTFSAIVTSTGVNIALAAIALSLLLERQFSRL